MARDGTAKPGSWDQIHKREPRQGKIFFPVQLATSRIGNPAQLMASLLKYYEHT